MASAAPTPSPARRRNANSVPAMAIPPMSTGKTPDTTDPNAKINSRKVTGMAIPSASEHKAEAKQFVAWMNSPEIATRLAEASSFFITARTSVLDTLGDSGMVAALKQYSDAGYVVPRPFHPQAAQAETIVDEIGQSYLTGQISIDEAMDRLKTEIADLG